MHRFSKISRNLGLQHSSYWRSHSLRHLAVFKAHLAGDTNRYPVLWDLCAVHLSLYRL